MHFLYQDYEFSIQRLSKASLLSGLMLLLGCQAVYADDMPAISNDPTKVNPIVEPPLRNKSQQDQGFSLPPVSKQSELEQKGGVVEITQVVFEGNKVFGDEELQEVVAPFLNRKLRASDLEAMRRKVSQFYIDHGYITSGALLVSQSLATGVLHLNIVESRLTDVKQTGQERLQEDYIRDRLMMGSGDPLNVKDLQDSYRQLLADPLIEQLNGQLLPGTRPGESILDLRVSRARPYQLYLGADDYQTPAVGAYTGRMGGWVDNLMTLGERIDANFVVNEGGLGYNTGINIPITARDTRFSFRYSDGHSSIVERPLDTKNISNHIIGYDAGLSHPIYRNFSDDITLGLNFVVRQNSTVWDGVRDLVNFCDCQVSVLRMSQHLSHRDEDHSLAFWSTFSTGLDVLGATINPAGLPSSDFFSWLGQSLVSLKLLDNGTMLVLRGNLQLANSPLLNLERYSLGGVYTVRGYRENTYVRDNGFNANVEVKYPIYKDQGDKHGLHLVPFLDYGAVWSNRPSTSTNNDQYPTNYLFSTGIGLNWQYKQLSADFYWAHAFTPVQLLGPKPERSIQDDGIHFRVNYNVF